jgi:hypothetical protein
MSLAGAARAENTPTGEGSSLSAKDKTFMKKAAKGGMMEVTMGKMAEQKPKARRKIIRQTNGHRSQQSQR